MKKPNDNSEDASPPGKQPAPDQRAGNDLLPWLQSLPKGSRFKRIDLKNEYLEPGTEEAIERLGPRARKVADRWVDGWPKQAKKMEADGTLLEHLKNQADREAQTLADARMRGENSHLADHEILEMYDMTPRPPV